eukprot:CAMPEP_0177418062 /NCGR_PEP_ID=MMETSP0368-20130122/68986_1 /TAXON_ID=447022 ORGANISM="Scrippsiella hangoei-like, Strain SHHI-4" /NCGR_SAMPLE_ID=MMETSP0368 /ASSEMBLY_ACC=CAM_ASM_000363 /LENGTH=181 /DNA_ID=CAMNT_0018887691 /DNA_START=157 /DNA_END=700 /DNA_ORIENTATION=-
MTADLSAAGAAVILAGVRHDDLGLRARAGGADRAPHHPPRHLLLEVLRRGPRHASRQALGLRSVWLLPRQDLDGPDPHRQENVLLEPKPSTIHNRALHDQAILREPRPFVFQVHGFAVLHAWIWIRYGDEEVSWTCSDHLRPLRGQAVRGQAVQPVGGLVPGVTALAGEARGGPAGPPLLR